MSHFKRTEGEGVSRRLRPHHGSPASVDAGWAPSVPLPDELFLTGEMRSSDDGVELELGLTWSTAEAVSHDESDSIKRGRPSQSGAPEGAKTAPPARSGR
jgi:hypothetical protein